VQVCQDRAGGGGSGFHVAALKHSDEHLAKNDEAERHFYLNPRLLYPCNRQQGVMEGAPYLQMQNAPEQVGTGAFANEV